MTDFVIELFGGSGGVGLGLRNAGCEAVGIELDADACATRAAARLLTIRADVSTYPLRHLMGHVLGIWASPPCGDFSRAGKRAGLKGRTGPLVWEPLRWAEALRPEWMACEETEDVLGIWYATALRLHQLGYSTWCGMLQTADYGVPQCRKRAILMASRRRAVHPPAPTHARHPHPDLFGNPPAPTVALGHHAAEWIWKRPSTTVQGTERIARPGHHTRQWTDSVPVSLEELAVLQGFPADWPFVGNKTSIARQIGNAVPPALAEAVVRSLTGAEALMTAGAA